MLDDTQAITGPQPTLGRIKSPDGAKAIRAKFSGSALQRLRDSEPLFYPTALSWVDKKDVAPTNFELAQLFAGLAKNGTDEAQFVEVRDRLTNK